ncbi:patatin-like phospholipase family protein [Gillisia sp. M10.2A]|uniref:Patatin-like phospholipase family protein n=1 Tax=Gillisia lutea TaxID=2909668 RepID=A0ABS9ECZ1_9FLAO|nr:patatin-like phospholipase family protein [Gillisia lutea]MCF4100746.1 patatin-like phospholipase family protein [Gillisia lutea]
MKKILFILILLLPFLGISQQQEDVKVGLVLSGGGAKGLAHIGVLKVIEESGIKIDYIGGSSMGAIVGALYASGYTSHQLDSIFHEINFNILIQDDIPRSSKTFYEKEDTEKYALTLPFDNFKVGFPSGLSKGQNIYNLISRLTMHLGDVRDFSKLPIPFFCIASNIETGEQVVLDHGSLAKAVSASGAIPSIFSPIKIEGKLLTDGGVTNNYPVKELRDRGAELIIGVDVQDSLMDRKQLRGVFDILTQISNFRTISDMREKIKQTDIYIKPNIKGFSVLSFEKGSAIIDSGEVAGKLKIERFKEIALKQKNRKEEVKKIPLIDSININALTIEGNNSYPRAYILGKLKLKYNYNYSQLDLNKGINQLAATGNFDRINYSLIPNNNAYTLAMQLEESQNKTFLRLALHYDDVYKSGALVNLTKKSSIFTNDVASLDIILGDNFRYNFQYYVDKGYYWSVGVKSRYNSFTKGVPFDFINENLGVEGSGINKIEVDYQDYTNQVYVETLFQQIFSFGMGLEQKYLKVTSETLGDFDENERPSSVFDKSHYYSAFGYLKLDSFDNKYFPTKGLFFDGDFHLYLFSSDYNENFSEFSIAKGAVGYVVSPFNRFTTKISSEVGFRVGNESTNILNFSLGGYGNDFINNFVPFYGYDYISISGDSYIKGLVELDYEIFHKNHITGSFNFANVGNRLFSTGDWFTAPDYTGYALGYGIETLLGPLEAKYSFSPENKKGNWFFSIGFWF